MVRFYHVVYLVCFCPGFFTDDLTIHNDIAGGGGKYLGVCQLPGGGRKVRVQVIGYDNFQVNIKREIGSAWIGSAWFVCFHVLKVEFW